MTQVTPKRQEIPISVGNERRIYDMAMWPLIGESRRLDGRILLFNEITERKQLEEQLFQTTKLSEMGEVAAGVAHELNNPLGVILTYAELLMRSIDREDQRADLQTIYEEAERGLYIVQNLLSFARQHPPKKSYVSINEILEKVLKLRSYDMERQEITVKRQLQPDLPRTMADADQMHQVFSNLVVNAEHAMGATNSRGTLQVMTRQVGDVIQVTFEDDGPGIPGEHLSKVFVPFFTTKEPGEGTGLGLSTCDGIMKQHGGKIEVHSEEGKGARFVVEIPLLSRHVSSVQTSRSESPESHGT